MVYCHTGGGCTWSRNSARHLWHVPHDVSGTFFKHMNGYTIKLDELCSNQNFNPKQVVSSELVFPKGAVPNSLLLWVRVELTNGKKKFITLPLVEFHRYVDLPESSIGGLTDGDHRHDSSGLNARYEVDYTGSSEPVPDELQHGTESAERVVEKRVPEAAEDRQDTGV